MEGTADRLFLGGMLAVVVVFVAAWLALVVADVRYIDRDSFWHMLTLPETRGAVWLSLWTSTLTTALGLVIALPMGYVLSRYRFPGHALADAAVDLPILLPPMIVGLSLLVFFRTSAGQFIERHAIEFVFQPAGIVLCQLLMSASFGIRVTKIAFDGIDPRLEQVAMTLGCTRAGAFGRVALPLAGRGIMAGAVLIWTRAVGTYGAVELLVGTGPRTMVLPTQIYLEQSVGRLEVALALAMLMLILASLALAAVRLVGPRPV